MNTSVICESIEVSRYEVLGNTFVQHRLPRFVGNLRSPFRVHQQFADDRAQNVYVIVGNKDAGLTVLNQFVAGRGWCAECHDRESDGLTLRDYFGMPIYQTSTAGLK